MSALTREGMTCGFAPHGPIRGRPRLLAAPLGESLSDTASDSPSVIGDRIDSFVLGNQGAPSLAAIFCAANWPMLQTAEQRCTAKPLWRGTGLRR